jgi:hypothetical protein
VIKILRNTFGSVLFKEDYPVIEIGNVFYIELDDKRRIKVSFYNTHLSDTYDSLKLELFHKENGNLHCQIVKFEDIFQCMQDLTHSNKIGKNIWYNNGKYSWYGKPTTEDIKALQEVLFDYIELWK